MARAVKRKATIKNYKLGYFVESKKYDLGSEVAWNQSPISKDQVNSLAGASQYAAAGVNMLQPGNGDTNEWASAGSGVLSGAGTGAKLGASFGPEGALIGAVGGALVGGVSGLISGNKQHNAYELQQQTNTKNAYFNTRNSMTGSNVDPYGTQMALGDLIPDGGDSTKVVPIVTQGRTNFPAPNDPYWKLNPLVTEHKDGTLRQWGEQPNNQLSTEQLLMMHQLNTPVIQAPQGKSVIQQSDKTAGYSNTYYPSNGQRTTPTPNSIPHNSYSTGGAIGLSGRASGRFMVPNAGMRHFAPHMSRVGHINPIPSNNIDFSEQSQNSPQTMAMGDSVQPTNSQQNQINIQKGELLINPEDGKILQDYKGINPLTGGMYEDHAKKQSDESPNNFTLADPGLFVITKKTAGQYQTAMDNNDKISQKTVLMNIRNAKIAKEGGLRPNYADGDFIDNATPTRGDQINMNYPTSNIPISSQPFGTNQVMSNNDPALNGMYIPDPKAKSNTLSNIGDTISKYGPAIYNIGQGIFGQTQHQAYATPVSNPYTNQVIANMPKNINMNPVINDIYSNENLANKNIQNQANSSAVYRANREGITTSTNRSLTDARMKAAEVNNSAAGQRAYMYNALGFQNQQEHQQERQYNLGVDEINTRRQAAKQNLLNAGLSQLQQTSMNDKENDQKKLRDQQYIQSMLQINPLARFYYNEDGTPKTR